MCVGDDSLTAFNDSLVELLLLLILAVTDVKLAHRCLCFGDHALKTLIDDLRVVHVDVADTVVEVVAYGEDTVVEEHVKHLRIHTCGGKVADGLALPVGVNLLQAFNSVLRNIEGIGLARGDRVELGLQPLEGVLGEGLAATGGDRVAANDQLALANDNRDIFQNMTECRRAALDNGQMLGFLIAFRNQLRAVGLDLGHLFVKMLDQAVDTRAFFNHKFQFSHNCFPLFIYRGWITVR